MATYKKPLSIRSAPSVRQLRAFVAVYHSGQLSSAAEALSLTQPAVTVLLRELEEKLGVRLFDRTTRSLRRTEAAVEAIDYAERVLDELGALAASMAEIARGGRGHVRIAATSTMAQTLLPQAMRGFMATHPDVKVMIDDCAPGQFVEKILSERVDLGVGTLEAPISGLQEQVLLRDRLSAVACADAGLPAGGLTWKQLARHPLVVVKPGYGVRQKIDQAASAAGVQLNIAHEASLLTTALAMAAQGLGVAVLPASILAYAHYPQLRASPLSRPVVERNIAVVTKSGRSLSPAAQSFLDHLAGQLKHEDA